MEYVIVGLTFAGIALVLFIKGVIDDRRRNKKVIAAMRREYGNWPEMKYETGELENIKSLFERFKNEHSIDDITAGDLELDDIFVRMNYCKSSLGASSLYSLLRNPVTDRELLNDLGNKVSYFENNEDDRVTVRSHFARIGKIKVGFFECIDLLSEVEQAGIFRDILAIILIFASIGVVFFNAPLGILMLIFVMCFNIITYYSEHGKIESYIVSFGYINRFILNAKNITGLKIDILRDEFDKIEECADRLKSFTRHAGLVVNRNTAIGSGNPLELLLDYVKMLFHIDIIYFYRMLSSLQNNTETFEELFKRLGRIESYVSIAYFRASLDEWCIPGESSELVMEEGFHPLITDPVKNSITADHGVLITGSNASGKSTFLKVVALNALLAQTIYTCMAKKFSGSIYSIFSSMSLRDDLMGNDSYFMVEIKAMKRILDYRDNNPDRKVLCFVDEVLRGTNTVERIAASTEILRYLSQKGCICFAATHDGELTYLLENDYDNYHFEEEIKDNDVLFNYRLNTGRAVTRNAIKLLSVMGFPEDIVKHAECSAEDFLEKGVWSV
ncbi:MAG: hypothetical protein K6A74_00660 [Lachnospiraceae bacterium]|nr:hypothetical protein [Lachnospiraceae bacterium]